MNKIVAFILLGALSTRLYCQEIPCATEVCDAYYQSMKQSMPEFNLFKTKFIAHMSEEGSRSFASKKNSVPIRIHIVRDNSGASTIDTALLSKGLNYMNRKFAGAGLEFYVCGAYDYINNTTYYGLDNTEFEALNNTYGTANIINIYLVNSIIFSGASAAGVAPTPGGSLWVMIRNNADTNVYAHEMGHFFGLLHTHGPSNTTVTNEFVDGSNGAEAGDYFADTPADPRLSPAISSGANVNAACIYFGNAKDGHNQTFVPDATNIMSYAPSKCLARFSNEQLAYMNWVYINRRANLTCSSVRVNFNSTTSVVCDSPYVFHFSNESAGLTTYRWDVNDDDVNDYTSTNPTHTYTSSGVKWVSLSGVSGGKTYMRYKPIEFIVPHKVPFLYDFNLSTSLLTGWKFINTDDARNWEFVQVVGSNGQQSNALRFRNFFYTGYEPADEIITNSFDLRGYKNARLSFDIAYAPHNATDTFLVYISTDCGVSYPTQILKLFGSSLQTHSKSYIEFIPSENDWKNVIIPINSYVNNYVRFKIVNFNKGGNDLYIDNIRVDGGDSTLNEVGFGRTALATSENSSSGRIACRGYRILSVPIFISSAPTSAINASITANGTATNGYDYEVLNSSIVFPIGSTALQYVNLRIWDDNASEALESLVLNISLIGSTSYRTTTKNRQVVISIYDNDPILPEQKTFSKVLLEEKFEGLPTDSIPGWTLTPYEWTSTSANGGWFWDAYLSTRNNSLDSTDYMVYWTGGGSHSPRSVYMESPIINIYDYDSITIELDQWYKVQLPYSGNIVVQVWNGSAWVSAYTYAAANGNLGLAFYPIHTIFSAVGYSNTDFKIRIGIVNDSGSFWYLVDNVKVTGHKRKPKVASGLNAGTSVYLGPNELVHIYDDSTGNVLASLQNLSSWDYGCTAISIDRAGDSIKPYLSIDSTYFATQKTLLITPSNNNTVGNYDISLYYTGAEINNWLSRTHNLLADFSIVKTGGHIYNITPSNFNANGLTNYSATDLVQSTFLSSNYKISGRFIQGFSGFAGAKSYSGPLALKMHRPLEATYEVDRGNVISWITDMEIDCDYFELQRSNDGLNFSMIANLPGHGNSVERNTYSYIDNQYRAEKNYYRFKEYDYNRLSSFSNIALVNNPTTLFSNVHLFPIPASTFFTIENLPSGIYTIRNNLGTLVKELSINSGAEAIDVSAIPNGIYFIEGSQIFKKFIVHH